MLFLDRHNFQHAISFISFPVVRDIRLSHPRILLLSAYRSDSHAYWVDWLTASLEADWRVLELPGRHFRWRIRGNPLSWLDALPEQLEGWQPDRILATSMVDLSTLRGLFPKLAAVPTSLYFHENQFAYPVSQGQHASIDPQMVQLYSALSADELLFNSIFNRDSFLNGIDALMRKLPDAKPQALVARLKPKCRWLPVPVETMSGSVLAVGQHNQAERPLILWNHRWEYDKYPEALRQLVEALLERGISFDLALLGAGADRPHAVKTRLQQVQEAVGDADTRKAGFRIAVSGFLPKSEYQGWVSRASFVFGAARHEFQGLALLEAAAAGAIPVVPDDLCYPEQYPTSCLYPVGDIEAAAGRIQEWLHRMKAGEVTRFESDGLAEWLAPATAQQWRDWLERISPAST